MQGLKLNHVSKRGHRSQSRLQQGLNKVASLHCFPMFCQHDTHQGWGLLSQFPPFRYFLNFFSIIKTHVFYWISRSFFDRCHCSLAVVAPVKYKCDSNNLRGTFARTKSFANGEIKEWSFSNPHLRSRMGIKVLVLKSSQLKHHIPWGIGITRGHILLPSLLSPNPQFEVLTIYVALYRSQRDSRKPVLICSDRLQVDSVAMATHVRLEPLTPVQYISESILYRIHQSNMKMHCEIKTKSCHDANLVATGGTRGCHYDNQWL